MSIAETNATCLNMILITGQLGQPAIRMRNDIAQEKDFWWLVGCEFGGGDGWIQTRNEPPIAHEIVEGFSLFQSKSGIIQKDTELSQGYLLNRSNEYKTYGR